MVLTNSRGVTGILVTTGNNRNSLPLAKQVRGLALSEWTPGRGFGLHRGRTEERKANFLHQRGISAFCFQSAKGMDKLNEGEYRFN